MRFQFHSSKILNSKSFTIIFSSFFSHPSDIWFNSVLGGHIYLPSSHQPSSRQQYQVPHSPAASSFLDSARGKSLEGLPVGVRSHCHGRASLHDGIDE